MYLAFGLTLFAGLSTGIGSAIALIPKKGTESLLTLAMGFSAGVMIYISFVELLPEGIHSIATVWSERSAHIAGVLAFFGGMLLIALIDRIVPSPENPHEFVIASASSEAEVTEAKRRSKLMRVGVFTAIVLALHNFPEGIATFAAAMKDSQLGLPVALAVALHNIPEGIAVAMPIFYATASKAKAFGYSLASGIAEPLGALVGYLILMQFMDEFVFGLLFSSIAGIMVFISFDQLLPAAEQYGKHHLSLYGLIGGMITMASSLLLFM